MLKKLLLSKPENSEMFVQTWLHNFDFDQQRFKLSSNMDHTEYTLKPGASQSLGMSPASPDDQDRLSPGSCDSVLNSPKIQIKTEPENNNDYEISSICSKRKIEHDERPSSTFSNDSGILTIVENPAPNQIDFEINQDYKIFKPKDELYKMNRISQMRKQQYIETQRKLYPIDFSYNPNKSRNLKKYSNASQAEERAKNNFASRRSRYKKKLEAQSKNFCLEFNMMECQQLWEEDKSLSDLIRYLEQICSRIGADKRDLAKIRQSCDL